MNLKESSTKLYFQIASFIIPLIVYIYTLAPTVSFIDSGELATVCIKLGVAHPTGYPLFTILGNVFSKMPIGEEIYRLNLMCAVISSLACVMFFNLLAYLFTSKNILENCLPKSVSDKKNIYVISLISTLTLAFSITFWSSSNAIEVYALHIFFLVTIIYIFLKACFEGNAKYWLLFGFVLGLSFTNHLTTIFLSIGTLYLFFSINGFNQAAFKKILWIAVFFIIGLTVYIYLPVRADNGVLSWGNPHDWENFYRHVSGKQFSVWMFSSSENAAKQFGYFTNSFPKEFGYVFLILAISGVIRLFQANRKVFYYTFLLFIFTVLYAINYDIYDIDSYFLLAYIVSGIWIAFGLLFLYEKLDFFRKFVYIGLVIPLILIYQNYSQANENDNFYVQDYTMNVFASAAPNAIIFSTQWDFWVSASFYYQYVENIRPDIIVIDKELLRRGWYLNHIEKNYSEVYNNSRAEFEAYKTELTKFERFTDRYTKPSTEADRQDLMKIQNAFLKLLQSLPAKNQTRPFYTTFEIEQSAAQERFGADMKRIPQGLLVRYTTETGFDNYTEPDFKFEATKQEGYHYEFLMTAYFNAYLNRANYLMNFGKYDEAEALINKAFALEVPQSQDAYRLLNKLKELRSLQQKN
ncbi:MAG TPA: DUF2723 domain-containing protein [Ignavibacteria bacterium]|nr:DUF2723 domain-containing protein [Ignavibacteria bacterium]